MQLRTNLQHFVIFISLSSCVCSPPLVKHDGPQAASGSAPRFLEAPTDGQDLSFSDEVLIRVPSKPNDGFNFPYYLYVPATAFSNKCLTLLVEPNNTGVSDDDFTIHDIEARKLATRGYTNRLAKRLASPMLVPVFPRPRKDELYVHYFNRKTILLTGGPMRRPDLQLLSMIEDARKLLSRHRLEIRPKVYMEGFSASSGFALRFTALHPDRVAAAAAGGVNALPILPVREWKGSRLHFPIGIDDLAELTGRSFDLQTWQKVPLYIYMGNLDVNDTVPFRDSWDSEDAELVNRLFGKIMMPDRWTQVQRVFTSIGSKAQFVTYNQIGHTVTLDIENNLVNFFLANCK